MGGSKKNKKTNEPLGRAIRNHKFGYKKKANDKEAYIQELHTTDITEKSRDERARKLKSVTETSSFEEFMENVELSEREFTAEKANMVIISSTSFQVEIPSEEQLLKQKQNWNRLKIPRRPKWDSSTSAEELHRLEKKSFLEWRRNLADLEEKENLVISPFERNLEVWKQLWRVVEKSNVIVQIVDARNPMLFRSLDLEQYVLEVDPTKKNLLLINKADLLNDYQRKEWSKFFISQNILFLYFSANFEQIKQENVQKKNSEEQESEEDETFEERELPSDPSHIYNREELLYYLEKNFKKNDDQERLMVGMVGYPNVGKSSTINVLVGSKKVGVAATPGKTKHFQTINLNDRICLCDCPGLVFPTFLSTKSDMICNGLLPIDNMRDHRGPVSLVCQRISRSVLEQAYGIILPKPKEGEDPNRFPTYEELLQAYAFIRGFMTVHGTPNESQAARLILKDYVKGDINYVYPPEGIDSTEFNKETINLKHVKTNKLIQTKNAPSNEQNQEPKTKKKVYRKNENPSQFKTNESMSGAKTTGRYGEEHFTRTQFQYQKMPTAIKLTKQPSEINTE